MSHLQDLLQRAINGTYSIDKKNQGFNQGAINYEFYSDIKPEMQSLKLPLGEFNPNKSPKELANEIINHGFDATTESAVIDLLAFGGLLYGMYKFIKHGIDHAQLNDADKLINVLNKNFSKVFNVEEWQKKDDFKTGSFRLRGSLMISIFNKVDVQKTINHVTKILNTFKHYTDSSISEYLKIIENNAAITKEIFAIGINGNYHDNPELLKELTPKFLPLLNKYMSIKLNIKGLPSSGELPGTDRMNHFFRNSSDVGTWHFDESSTTGYSLPYLTKEQAIPLVKLINEINDTNYYIYKKALVPLEDKLVYERNFYYPWADNFNGGKKEFHDDKSMEMWMKLHPNTVCILEHHYDDVGMVELYENLTKYLSTLTTILGTLLLSSVKDKPSLKNEKPAMESLDSLTPTYENIFSDIFSSFKLEVKQEHVFIKDFLNSYNLKTIHETTKLKQGHIKLEKGYTIISKEGSKNWLGTIAELSHLASTFENYVMHTKSYYHDAFLHNVMVGKDVLKVRGGLDRDFEAMDSNEIKELKEDYLPVISKFKEINIIAQGIPSHITTIGFNGKPLINNDEFTYGNISDLRAGVLAYPNYKEILSLLDLIERLDKVHDTIDDMEDAFYDLNRDNGNPLFIEGEAPFKSTDDESIWCGIDHKTRWMYVSCNAEKSAIVYMLFRKHLKEVMLTLANLIKHTVIK